MADPWQLSLGWTPELEAAMAPFAERGLHPARVSLVYRKQLRLLTARGELWARIGGKLMHRARDAGELPAVGDWVAARLPAQEGEALVQTVLPRRTAFVRKVPGKNATPHVLATNVDTVLVVMGLDEDFNLRRVERYLSLAWESRATPVVVLNKLDLCAEPAARLAEVQAVAREARCLLVSALTGAGLDALQGIFGAGQTVVLLGSSGVGKSTLVNRVLGAEVMSTGALSDDGKGRHTTSRRELIVLPSGAAIIDTPGLREVQLWDAGGGVTRTFDDIEALAQGCRFSNCRHDEEPDCAVRAALEAGTLSEGRFESWSGLQRELAWLAQPGERGRPESKRRARAGHGVRRK